MDEMYPEGDGVDQIVWDARPHCRDGWGWGDICPAFGVRLLHPWSLVGIAHHVQF